MQDRLHPSFLTSLKEKEVTNFCLCPGNRNVPLLHTLFETPDLNLFFWPEERSAGFFALGRIKATKKPAAVVVTSGTAVAELLPAMIEAYYQGVPLLAITADRPRRLRGTGAAQTIDQVALFGPHTHFFQDTEELVDLSKWECRGPAHLNICIEERDYNQFKISVPPSFCSLEAFFTECKQPFVIVGGIRKEDQAQVRKFLASLAAPCYIEAISGLQNAIELAPYQLSHLENPFTMRDRWGIDGVLRIGSIPTHRFWKQLEHESLPVLVVSHLPFSGLSWQRDTLSMESLQSAPTPRTVQIPPPPPFHRILQQYPKSEPTLLHQLTQKIPSDALIYLGNSMPIRQWDLVSQRHFTNVEANRGANGIDGQLSTFFGLAKENLENWAFIGDLTALYDLVAPWILSQLPKHTLRIVIINNGGGRIISHFFPDPRLIHPHTLSFAPLAALWQLPYFAWTSIPDQIDHLPQQCLIELLPEVEETAAFWKKHPLK